MLEPARGAPRHGAEDVEIADQGFGCGRVRPDPQRGGVIGEPQHEQRIGEHEGSRRRGAAAVVLIEPPQLPGREAMRSHRLPEAHTILLVGARQRDEIFHGGVRGDEALADVLLNRVRERADQTEATRDPADTAIEASRHLVERQPVLLVQGAEQPRLLEDVLDRISLEEMAKDQGLAGRHVPDDRGDRIAVQPVQAAHAFVAVHHEVPRVAGHDDDRQLLADVGK